MLDLIIRDGSNTQIGALLMEIKVKVMEEMVGILHLQNLEVMVK